MTDFNGLRVTIPVFALTRQAVSALDVAISHVGHPRLEISKTALLQLDLILRDKTTSQFVTDHVDHLLCMVATQLRNLMSILPSTAPSDLKTMDDQYSCIMKLLATIFRPKNDLVTSQVTKDTLCDLILLLITTMTHKDVGTLTNGQRIISFTNVLILRIIEYCEPAAVICGLVGMLNVSLQLISNEAVMDLVLKCEAKLLKQFPIWASKGKHIEMDNELEAVVREFHSFIRRHTFRAREDKKDAIPMKTVKVILYKFLQFVDKQRVQQVLLSASDLKDSKTASIIRKIERCFPKSDNSG